MKYITLTPAYGRDYKSKKEVESAFRDGMDFILHDFGSRWDGKPCSIRDFCGNEGTTFTLRYDKLRKVHTVTIGVE